MPAETAQAGRAEDLLATVRSVADLRAALAPWRCRGLSIGLVPTMGGLHAGHLALVDRAHAACDRVVATLFVNPMQFDRPDDLAAYPRTEATDAASFAEHGVDLLFAPPADEMYPNGFATTVSVARLTDCLCGIARPGHFEGVATVVCKLLLQSMPTAAFFGEKDYQQLQVIRRMVADLDIPVTVEGVATVREADGLALSSRNFNLSAEQRAVAPLLNQVLRECAAALADGGTEAGAVLEAGRRRLLEGGFARVDYLDLRAADGLAALARADRPARIFGAAWLGPTRLIDNVAVAS